MFLALQLSFWHQDVQSQHNLFEVCQELSARLVENLEFLWMQRTEKHLGFGVLPRPRNIICWKELYKVVEIDKWVFPFVDPEFAKFAEQLDVSKKPCTYLDYLTQTSKSNPRYLTVMKYLLTDCKIDNDVIASAMFIATSFHNTSALMLLIRAYKGKYWGAILCHTIQYINYDESFNTVYYYHPELTEKDITTGIVAASCREATKQRFAMLINHPEANIVDYYARVMEEVVSSARLPLDSYHLDILLNALSKSGRRLSCRLAITRAIYLGRHEVVEKIVSHPNTKLSRKTISELLARYGKDSIRKWLRIRDNI